MTRSTGSVAEASTRSPGLCRALRDDAVERGAHDGSRGDAVGRRERGLRFGERRLGVGEVAVGVLHLLARGDAALEQIAGRALGGARVVDARLGARDFGRAAGRRPRSSVGISKRTSRSPPPRDRLRPSASRRCAPAPGRRRSSSAPGAGVTDAGGVDHGRGCRRAGPARSSPEPRSRSRPLPVPRGCTADDQRAAKTKDRGDDARRRTNGHGSGAPIARSRSASAD